MSDFIADLHCHSTVSDGVLTPEQVVKRAYCNQVSMLALTDHDETAGLISAQEKAHSLGMIFVPGVEVSVTFLERTVHIVGLGIDPYCEVLNQGLNNLRQNRQGRAKKIANKLEAFGFKNAYEGAMALVSNPDLVSRTHFARFLVAHNYCKSMQEVFERYLGDGKPADVSIQWASLEQAVSWIHQAGGKAVIAHPGRYKFKPAQFRLLFDTFKQLGGEGIEVATGSHTNDQFRHYARIAQQYKFQASIGSDFHDPGSRYDLGTLPALPEHLLPIWHRSGWV